MADFRVGYMYSLAPIHCGGEGDLGNILEIAREVHTNFPYIPGSSLRGSLRDGVEILDPMAAPILFGKELDEKGQMGVHQVWFGDARLLWIPMRTMSVNNRDVFTWVSCHSLIRDHAIISRQKTAIFPSEAVGTRAGVYSVADAQITVKLLSNDQKQAISLTGWPNSLKDAVQPTWKDNLIILPDADFQVLMEHSLWTQVRNKIQEEVGSAEIFWTDICIPRDTIFYYPWGYSLLKNNPITEKQHDLLISILQELFQVGGQANVGRGWVQGWTNHLTTPIKDKVIA
ncbi:MAG: type III-B CRISPR module RAMP protein Cmr4 [Dolichospermum sp. DET50]|jgi:CRISPR-associated protein Cmr4|nr:type III-B CRISPR module RAMP protein Cmr4 [Dolichospermum sp. DET66]MBS3033954.1 type III-B CRISPR module RAMP protein Cmr4 [Dolichospermum sp. DET67]MBS3039157.1 type III-B CRISPR module RAMP protein Cmr4 [Dolichospermum sp. DET50]QSX66397.1 MAG: type III-B CRISPR module RAMP protein Cmr4 [Dolichospermum sp. DET69]